MEGSDLVTHAVKVWGRLTPDVRHYRDYAEGRHRDVFSTEAFRRHYSRVLAEARENLCAAVVDVFAAPVMIESWEGAGADRAEELWEDTALRTAQVLQLGITESITTGDAFVLVWPGPDGTLRPHFHAADQMVTHTEDGRLAWAVKIWTETAPAQGGRPAETRARVNVYLVDRVERWTAPAFPAVPDHEPDWTALWPEDPRSWYRYDLDGEPDTIRHSFGQVPVIHLSRRQARIGGRGRSVLADVVPLQDGLNHSLASLIVNGEAFARPLRALVNMAADEQAAETVLDPATGTFTTRARDDRSKIAVDPTRQSILGFPGTGQTLVQLDPPDATRLLAVQDAFALKIARAVGAPSYYFTQTSGDVPSGEALRVLSSRLTAAVRDYTRSNTGEVSRLLALLGAGEVRPVWEDPAPASETEHLAMLQTKQQIGWPVRELMIDAGEDPARVDQMLREADDARSAAAAEALRRYRAGADADRFDV